MTRVRVGVIGVGAVAQMMHLPYLRELEDRFQISALCDIDPVVLAEVGRQYGVTRLFKDADALLAEPLDAVLVLTSGDHAPVTLTALERGLHLLVEKPLAYTLRETDEVISAAARAGTILMVGMMKQYDPGYRRGVELVQALRDLRYVSATTREADGTAYMSHHPIVRGKTNPPREKQYGAAMFTSVQESILAREPLDLLAEGAGHDDPDLLTAYALLISSSIHDINALRGALGQPDAVLSASLWAGGTSFTATLAYANEVRANYTWTLIPHLKSYSQTFSFHGSDARVDIRFPSPYLRNAPTHVDLERMNDGELEQTRLTVSYEEAFKLELLEFHDCVQTGRTPRTDAAGFRQDLDALIEIARQFPRGSSSPRA